MVREHSGRACRIGIVGFLAPYVGVLAFAHFVVGWPWPQAQIAGISLSTTSVAVVYAVMIETGFNRTEIGKIILAACFVNDLGTVLALGLVFAHYDIRLAGFVGVTVVFAGGAGALRAAAAGGPGRPGERAADQVRDAGAAVAGRAGERGGQRGGAAGLSGRHGAGADLPARPRACQPDAHRGLHAADAVLFPQGRLAGRGARGDRRRRADRWCSWRSRW